MNNDRLKFRVWDTKQDKYITNVLIMDEDEDEEITHEYYNFMINQEGRLCANRDDCSDRYTGSDSVQYMDSDRFIVEMCTGLRDKNGTLIYEGDIIQAPNTPQEYIITWGHHGFISTCGCHSYPMSGTDLFEIIGNIHEQKDKQCQI